LKWSEKYGLLYLASGHKKVEFASIAYNEKSSFVVKRIEIPNLNLIRVMAEIVKLEEVSIDFILP